MTDRSRSLLFFTLTAVALWFLSNFALSYLTTDSTSFGIYWPRHKWVYAHIIGGMAALLLGPAQLLLGLNRTNVLMHQILGGMYVFGVAIGGTAGLYLAIHTDFGWMFGISFAAMACAWLVSTMLATIAICRRFVQQHHEWMIRSYVVTFGFVTFRILVFAFDVTKTGTMVERMTAASWLSWSVPLLVTEWILQGRKILGSPASEVQFRDVNACNVVLDPAEFDLQSSESSYLHRQ